MKDSETVRIGSIINVDGRHAEIIGYVLARITKFRIQYLDTKEVVLTVLTSDIELIKY